MNSREEAAEVYNKAALEYFDGILRELSSKYNAIFVGIWDKYEKYVVDSTHLNHEGHRLLFEEVKCLL